MTASLSSLVVERNMWICPISGSFEFTSHAMIRNLDHLSLEPWLCLSNTLVFLFHGRGALWIGLSEKKKKSFIDSNQLRKFNPFSLFIVICNEGLSAMPWGEAFSGGRCVGFWWDEPPNDSSITPNIKSYQQWCLGLKK